MTISPSDSADELVRAGAAALRAGERERARSLLVRAVRVDPRSERAWLFLAGALTDPGQRRECLQRVLRLNPANPAALRGMELLRARPLVPADTPPVGGPEAREPSLANLTHRPELPPPPPVPHQVEAVAGSHEAGPVPLPPAPAGGPAVERRYQPLPQAGPSIPSPDSSPTPQERLMVWLAVVLGGLLLLAGAAFYALMLPG